MTKSYESAYEALVKKHNDFVEEAKEGAIQVSDEMKGLRAALETTLEQRDEYRKRFWDHCHHTDEQKAEAIKMDDEEIERVIAELRMERDELIKAHDTQCTIAKQFQKLFREVEPEMTKLIEERDALRSQLEVAVKALTEIANYSGKGPKLFKEFAEMVLEQIRKGGE